MTGGTIVCDVTDPTEGHGAAAFASALGKRLGLRVVLAYIGDWAEHDPDQAFGSIAHELDADVELRLMSGDHAEALARMAAEEGADLIILGSRAVGFGGRNLRCTLVRDLEAATPVPVLVAPPSTRRRSRRRLDVAAYADTR
jgi:nucleotide-binding universal stress UspA family protein